MRRNHISLQEYTVKIVRMLTFSAALVLAGCSSSDLGPHPDFTGKWKYNESLSDNTRERMREERGSHGRGGGGRGGWGGGGEWGGMGPGGTGPRGGMSPRGGWGRDGREGREGRDGGRGAFEASDTLEIVQTADAIRIRDDRGVETDFPLTGKKTRLQLDGRDADVKAKWKSARLVTITDINAGPLFQDVWELSADGKYLVDTHSVEGGRFQFKVRRVYDRDTGMPSPTPAP